MIRYRVVLATLAVGFALAACNGNVDIGTQPTGNVPTPVLPSGGTPSVNTGGAANTDCASLATAAEVSDIVGTEVTGPKSASTASVPIQGLKAVGCNYTGNGAIVLFIVGTGPDANTVQQIFQQAKQAQSGEDVSGVGDQAFFAPDTDTLVAIQGSTFLSIALGVGSLGDKSAEKDAAVQLGTQVLGRFSGS